HLADVKFLNGYTILTIAHTHFGMPVWQSGFDMIIQVNGPTHILSVLSSHSTLHEHTQLETEPRFAPTVDGNIYAIMPFAPRNISKSKLAQALDLDQAVIKPITGAEFAIYKYDPNTRVL